jgi:hypothetical protein
MIIGKPSDQDATGAPALSSNPKWENGTGDNGCFHYGLHGFTEKIPVLKLNAC